MYLEWLSARLWLFEVVFAVVRFNVVVILLVAVGVVDLVTAFFSTVDLSVFVVM